MRAFCSGKTKPFQSGPISATYAYESDIVVLGRTKSHGQDPMGNGTMDKSPGHDTALGSMLSFCRRASGGLVAVVV